ncbi:hypothetical protein ACQCVP_18970 [Rossellomorea vietnamensis]|uniref:hypothetical protein n=1 Tax=Rossellomorea vietnamensis TaxID=218284 RepID=UPI003CFBA8B1
MRLTWQPGFIGPLSRGNDHLTGPQSPDTVRYPRGVAISMARKVPMRSVIQGE